MKILLKGKQDSIIVRCDTANKYEIVIASHYKNETWERGKYFTLRNEEVTTENKAKLIKDVMEYWIEYKYF